MTNTTQVPNILFTAVGIFQAGSDWIVEVAVPNFPTREDAEAYAPAFRIMLVDGRQRRDDGKGTGVFDESWREVLDSQVTLLRVKAPQGEPEPVNLPIAQWQSEPGLRNEFEPVAWHVDQDKL